jgi:beta-glucosidase
MPKDLSRPHEIVDGRDPAARPVLLNGAIEGHVLVKNTKDTLPLKKPRLLSVYGYSAKTPDSFFDTIPWILGAQPVDINEALSGALGQKGNYSSIGINGTLFGGCGSGATTPANMLSPFEALKARTYQDGAALHNNFYPSGKPTVDPMSDACIVFANAWACEGYDRHELEDEYTDSLIKSVADNCNKTVVVFHNAGPRLVDGFIDHPNVSAIIYAHLPGQDSGPAIVSLLYGESNPSGKLPYTVAKNASDYGSLLEPAQPEGKFINFPQADFDEGVYTDYRHFDKQGIEPRYEFGFGMSYTTFNMSNLTIMDRIEGANTDEWPTGAVITGGQADLWDYIASVTVDVSNTGSVDGAEVAQLYVGIPNAPAKQLRGFEKVFLQKRETRAVTLGLRRRDLSIWNVEMQKWQLQRGEYKVYVGNSSRNLPLEATLNV